MIEFCDVTFAYERTATGQAAGVSHIDLAVPQGSCVLVCGPSGCGKTTLTRLANGLAPTFFPGSLSGRVLIDGRDCAQMRSWEVALSVGSVFQNPRTQFFNVDSTGEVAFALESCSTPEETIRERVAETMDELGIRHLADRNIFSLSGGEKQRIAFASVWAARPANLVLDEPTSNLDMAAIMDLRSYVARAKASGTSVLVAEHRLWWLLGIADEVVVMDGGRIVRRFSPQEFASLPVQEVGALGLRARSLAEVEVAATTRGQGGFQPREAAGQRAGEVSCTGESLQSGAPPQVNKTARLSEGCQAKAGLAVRGVRAGYRKREVLRGVDFSASGGEVIALVGRNGAGKSTLSRAICGLAKSSGGYQFFGEEAGEQERLARSSMVFQDVNYQLFADSAAAEVVFGMDKNRARTVDVTCILSLLGLSDVADRHPATLSGGQKQRLAIASCVAAGKDVLVFDEPTSGLDLASMRRVAGLIRRLAAEGRVVLVVTHDLEFIACACDCAVELSGGAVAGIYDVANGLDGIRRALFFGAQFEELGI